jgi:hypothetical protein
MLKDAGGAVTLHLETEFIRNYLNSSIFRVDLKDSETILKK